MPRRPKSKLAVTADLAHIERTAQILGGIPVWEVFPRSEAERAGIRFGDIVLSVNGTATPTFDAFLRAGARHLAELEFEVFRNGATLRLSRVTQTDA
jgi:S1-C subfamily serine protease